jgi:hypothetical protein
MISEKTKNGSSKTQIQSLLELSLKGLVSMFYPKEKVFCYRLRRTDQGLMKEGVSHRYTLMTLMGLSKAESAGLVSPFRIDDVLDRLRRDTQWIDNAGDLGLFLWTCAIAAPDFLPQIAADLHLETALDRYADTRAMCTMELAWFLAGLSHMRLTNQPRLPDVEELAFETYRLLKSNHGRSGLFGHSSTRGSIAGKFRGRIGSFADQVYPIYALSKFGQAFGVPQALEDAKDCAEEICRLQGPLGQWWWHYDSKTGRIAGKYAVYSVHQDGMAPLALFALSEATGQDFSGPILRGLEWISGKNELGIDLCDFNDNLIWRSLYQGKTRTYMNEALHLLRLPGSSSGLRVRYETRPYHLGWLLYAFAAYGANEESCRDSVQSVSLVGNS